MAVWGAEAQNSTLPYHSHFLEKLLMRAMPQPADVEYMLCQDDPQVIEPDRNDPRGPSCLVWAIMMDGRAGHMLLTWPPDSWVITAYWPDSEPAKWTADFKQRASQRRARS